ncbi:MAG: hypothetical protein IK030_04380 [Bacteroidales bacterium]|nr:hypothetical protein [Bacteroidales bacterium]
MKARYLIIAAFSFLAMAACQQLEPETLVPETVPAASDSLFTLTVQASKGFGTKALWVDTSGDPDVLKAYWKSTEKVKVFRNGSYVGELGVSCAGEKPATATLTGNIVISGPSLTVGDNLMLMLPRQNWDYTGQNGSLATLETTYDYATATVRVSSISGSAVTTDGTADFTNEQSVYRFGFKVSGDYIDPKAFTVSAAGGQLVQSMSWNGSAWTADYGNISVIPSSAPGDHFYYVSLRNDQTTDDTYNFTITGSDDALYMASKPIPSSVLDAPGKFISAQNVGATKPDFAPGIASGEVSNPLDIL